MKKEIDMTGFLEAIKDLTVNGMVVYQNDELLVHYQPKPEEKQNQYSGTKSFTSTAVGFAVQEGLFSMEDYVLDYFKEDAPEQPSENLQKMKLKHLITMSMGFESPMLMGVQRPTLRETEKDWVKYVLYAPVTHEPGSVFQYNNAGPYLLGILIERKAGCSLCEYLTPRLFEPLGMEIPVFELDPQGHCFGAGGMISKVSDLAKLGLLYLHEGTYKDRQLLSREWVKAAVATQIQANEGDEEIGHAYAYLFWTMPDGMYRVDGKYGQYCIVMPRQNAVIAVNSMQIQNEKDVLRAVVRNIVPQL